MYKAPGSVLGAAAHATAAPGSFLPPAMARGLSVAGLSAATSIPIREPDILTKLFGNRASYNSPLFGGTGSLTFPRVPSTNTAAHEYTHGIMSNMRGSAPSAYSLATPAQISGYKSAYGSDPLSRLGWLMHGKSARGELAAMAIGQAGGELGNVPVNLRPAFAQMYSPQAQFDAMRWRAGANTSGYQRYNPTTNSYYNVGLG